MKALILAAGYGNRMRPLTDQKHKTLVEVGGRTIIDRIIDGLTENGITDIVVVTGYRHEELRDHLLKTHPALKFSFVHNERYRETNNIFSMALALEQMTIDSDVVLIESDLVFHPSVIQRLLQNKHPTVALVDHFRSGMDGTVVTVENGVITAVIPPHLQSDNFDYSDKFKTLNIYKFSKEFCATAFKKLLTYYATTIDANCYYELILGILIYMQRETIHAEIVAGEPWAEIDDPNDLQNAEFVFNVDRKGILQNSFGGYWNHDILDFCFIRNMYFPPPAIISEMKNVLPALIHNYGSRQERLNQKLAWFLLCRSERVFLLNGASQIYPLLREFFSGKKALVPAPTFGEYERCFPGAATYADAVGVNTAALQKAAEAADCIVFVNPNNPSGTVLQSEWLFAFAKQAPRKTVIVDESFIEFSGQPSLLSLLEKEALQNVIVIKSLSKSLGIPGIRLGYAYACDPAFLAYVNKNTPIWNSNSLAEFTLEIILKYRKELAQSFEDTRRDREAFAAILAASPYVERVYPSGGNFLLAKLSDRAPAAATVVEALLRRGIYVKDISGKFHDRGNYLRIAVRLPEENAIFAEGLGKAVVS
ncbi:MAG: aminotransferase class I/II-fold pyridoxal phosphate-dependent enzyme [Chitinivibrionales bacterium]|nr:aminotransferase class I/II-fold pyridoxal phosphate-dependent enzyme [Chitinivibrionales bacterium]